MANPQSAQVKAGTGSGELDAIAMRTRYDNFALPRYDPSPLQTPKNNEQ